MSHSTERVFTPTASHCSVCLAHLSVSLFAAVPCCVDRHRRRLSSCYGCCSYCYDCCCCCCCCFCDSRWFFAVVVAVMLVLVAGCCFCRSCCCLLFFLLALLLLLLCVLSCCCCCFHRRRRRRRCCCCGRNSTLFSSLVRFKACLSYASRTPVPQVRLEFCGVGDFSPPPTRRQTIHPSYDSPEKWTGNLSTVRYRELNSRKPLSNRNPDPGTIYEFLMSQPKP